MAGINRIPLKQEQFDVFGRLEDWAVKEIPKERWTDIPGAVRPKDLIAVMISGSLNAPQISHGLKAVVGIDFLAYESNPMTGEPEGNAYHMVIFKVNRTDFPYVLAGPFKDGTTVAHWFQCSDLNSYPQNTPFS